MWTVLHAIWKKTLYNQLLDCGINYWTHFIRAQGKNNTILSRMKDQRKEKKNPAPNKKQPNPQAIRNDMFLNVSRLRCPNLEVAADVRCQRTVCLPSACPCSLVYPAIQLPFKSSHSVKRICQIQSHSSSWGKSLMLYYTSREAVQGDFPDIHRNIRFGVPFGRSQEQCGPQQGFPGWKSSSLPCTITKNNSSCLFWLHFCLTAKHRKTR